MLPWNREKLVCTIRSVKFIIDRDNVLGSVRLSVCQSIRVITSLRHLSVCNQGACVCNQGACTDNSTAAVDRLLILMSTVDSWPYPFLTLSEETAHSTVYHHLSHQSSCIKTAQQSLRWRYTVDWAIFSESVLSCCQMMTAIIQDYSVTLEQQ